MPAAKIGVNRRNQLRKRFSSRAPDAFKQLCHDVAMHIAAVDPRYVRPRRT